MNTESEVQRMTIDEAAAAMIDRKKMSQRIMNRTIIHLKRVAQMMKIQKIMDDQIY